MDNPEKQKDTVCLTKDIDSWLEPSKYLKQEHQTIRSIVRRLTPKECCRLMLIPEDHPFVDGDATSDSSVFKAQGNGWARNQSRWVFKRQHEVDEKFVTGHRKPFKIGTLSSGQGTHELSVEDFGDISLFASEIDPFPCRVIAERFPNTVNFGDMTRIDYDAEKGVIHNRLIEGYEPMSKEQLGFVPVDAEVREIPLKYGELDVLSGGLPCTDVSVAGKRAGATEGSGSRSALAFELPRIGSLVGARWLVYENVLGMVSSHGGKDFGWFLYRVMQAGYTIAWRTLDAQVTFCDMAPRAVPQRRMRIWMVAYRGDDWRIPCRVLFEPMKVLGTEPPRRIVGRGFLKADPTFDPNEAEFLDVYKKKKGADDGARGDLFSMFFGEPEPDDYAHYKPRKLTRAEVEVSFPEEADIRKVKPAEMVRFMRNVGFSDKGMYAGPLFAGDKDWRNGEVTPDDLAKGFLENLGTGGIISQGFAATLKMPTWNAGITEEELAEMDEVLRELYDGTVCGLSDVLYRDVDGKYRLSWRACWGILVRAETRGKKLPELLEDALLWQIAWNPEHVKWAMLNAKNEEERGKAADCWKRVIEPNAALFNCPLDEIVPESPKKAEDDSAEDDDDDGDDADSEEAADEIIDRFCEDEAAEGTGDEA